MKKFLILGFALLLSSVAQAQTDENENMPKFSFAPLIEKVTPFVVNVSAERPNAEKDSYPAEFVTDNPSLRDYFLLDEGGKTSLGSGFIIDSKGYIITDWHIIKGADKVNVILHDGQSFVAQLVGSDEPTDLAVIKINYPEALPFADLGDSDALKIGDLILTAGNPFGLGTSFSSGIVSAKSRDIDMGIYDNFIQTDASINQGSSGGPMFDMNGKVVGINTALFSSTGDSVGVGFATPSNLVRFIISRLMETGKVERAWIGIKISSQDKTLEISESQTFTGGVLITSVTPGSPAQKSELEAGDIITALNGRDVKDVKDFSRRIAEMPIGREVILRLWRAGQIKDFAVQTALRPDTDEVKPPVNTELSEEGYIPNLGMAFAMSEEGVVIRDVLQGSPAFTMGIQKGNVVKAVNSHPVSSISDVMSYIGYASSGDGVLQMTLTGEDDEEHTVNMEIKSVETAEDNAPAASEAEPQ